MIIKLLLLYATLQNVVYGSNLLKCVKSIGDYKSIVHSNNDTIPLCGENYISPFNGIVPVNNDRVIDTDVIYTMMSERKPEHHSRLVNIPNCIEIKNELNATFCNSVSYSHIYEAKDSSLIIGGNEDFCSVYDKCQTENLDCYCKIKKYYKSVYTKIKDEIVIIDKYDNITYAYNQKSVEKVLQKRDLSTILKNVENVNVGLYYDQDEDILTLLCQSCPAGQTIAFGMILNKDGIIKYYKSITPGTKMDIPIDYLSVSSTMDVQIYHDSNVVSKQEIEIIGKKNCEIPDCVTCLVLMFQAFPCYPPYVRTSLIASVVVIGILSIIIVRPVLAVILSILRYILVRILYGFASKEDQKAYNTNNVNVNVNPAYDPNYSKEEKMEMGTASSKPGRTLVKGLVAASIIACVHGELVCDKTMAVEDINQVQNVPFDYITQSVCLVQKDTRGNPMYFAKVQFNDAFVYRDLQKTQYDFVDRPGFKAAASFVCGNLPVPTSQACVSVDPTTLPGDIRYTITGSDYATHMMSSSSWIISSYNGVCSEPVMSAVYGIQYYNDPVSPIYSVYRLSAVKVYYDLNITVYDGNGVVETRHTSIDDASSGLNAVFIPCTTCEGYRHHELDNIFTGDLVLNTRLPDFGRDLGVAYDAGTTFNSSNMPIESYLLNADNTVSIVGSQPDCSKFAQQCFNDIKNCGLINVHQDKFGNEMKKRTQYALFKPVSFRESNFIIDPQNNIIKTFAYFTPFTTRMTLKTMFKPFAGVVSPIVDPKTIEVSGCWSCKSGVVVSFEAYSGFSNGVINVDIDNKDFDVTSEVLHLTTKKEKHHIRMKTNKLIREFTGDLVFTYNGIDGVSQVQKESKVAISGLLSDPGEDPDDSTAFNDKAERINNMLIMNAVVVSISMFVFFIIYITPYIYREGIKGAFVRMWCDFVWFIKLFSPYHWYKYYVEKKEKLKKVMKNRKKAIVVAKERDIKDMFRESAGTALQFVASSPTSNKTN